MQGRGIAQPPVWQQSLPAPEDQYNRIFASARNAAPFRPAKRALADHVVILKSGDREEQCLMRLLGFLGSRAAITGRTGPVVNRIRAAGPVPAGAARQGPGFARWLVFSGWNGHGQGVTGQG